MSEQPGTQQPGTVREATPNDMPTLLSLAADRCAHFAKYQPVFWRSAPEAAQVQEQFFGQVFADPGVLALVHERDGAVDGFLIAVLMPPPPIYAPGGPLCSIEELWVAGGADWEGAGRALLDAAAQAAKASGAVQIVVVCARLNEGERALLSGSQYGVAAEQWVATL